MTDTVQPPLDRSVRSAESDFRVGRVFNQTFAVLSRNVLPFCIVTGVAALPHALLFSQNPARYSSAGAVATSTLLGFLLMFVLYGVSQAVILYGAFEDMLGRPVNVVESLRVGLRRFFPVIGTAILVGILIGLGAIALLIPGIIVMTMAFVAMPACVVERLGPVKSIGRSAQLTKGNRWKIFGLWLVLAVVGGIVQAVLGGLSIALAGPFVGGIVLLIWNAVFGAFSAILAVVAYRDLRVAKEGVDTDQIVAVFS